MLKLQNDGPLMQRPDSLEKTLMLGKTEGRRNWGQQKIRWLDGIIDSMDMSLSKLWERWRTEEPGVLQSMGSQTVGHDTATEKPPPHHLLIHLVEQVAFSLGLLWDDFQLQAWESVAVTSNRNQHHLRLETWGEQVLGLNGQMCCQFQAQSSPHTGRQFIPKVLWDTFPLLVQDTMTGLNK